MHSRTQQTLQTTRAVDVFGDPDATATALLIAWLDTWPATSVFGTEEERYSPETILLELRSEVGGRLVSQNYQLLMAAIEVVVTDHFTSSTPDFVRLCNILAGDDPGETFDTADASEICWAVLERAVLLGLVYGDDAVQADPPCSAEIRAYVRRMLDAEGISRIPAVLRGMFLRAGEALGDDFNTDLADDPVAWQIADGVQAGHDEQLGTLVASRLERLTTQLAAFTKTAARRIPDDWAAPALPIAARLLMRGKENDDDNKLPGATNTD